MKLSKTARRKRIHRRIRKNVFGTDSRPRVSVYRSNKEIYAQVIDDKKGVTILAASSLEFDQKEGSKVEQAKKVGQLLAEKAVAAGLSSVVFDRNGYLYHGRVKALAEGAREGGLVF